MAASDALSVEGDSTATAGSAASGAVTASESGTASGRRAQLLPVAQLVAVVVGVLTIIWNQQHTIDSLRTEMGADISGVESSLRAELRAEIGRVESSLRAEIGELRAEVGELRAEVSENGQRLARIEGFLGIGVPGDGPGPAPDGRGPPGPADPRPARS